jgi:5S rRNA maturation endonuclease (ribonuclease M5)
MKDPAEVLEALDDILADLGEAAAQGAIIVEGRRDVKALASLHIEGAVEVMNRGAPLLALCDALAADHRRITVLTDWDAKGEELARQLEGGLRRACVEVDMASRDALRRLTRGAVHAVEELPSFHRRVAAAVASKGASVRVATDWKERKEITLKRRAIRKQRGGPPGRRP